MLRVWRQLLPSESENLLASSGTYFRPVTQNTTPCPNYTGLDAKHKKRELEGIWGLCQSLYAFPAHLSVSRIAVLQLDAPSLLSVGISGLLLLKVSVLNGINKNDED